MGRRYHFIVHPIHEISLCYCLLMIYILSICHAWDGCSDECYNQILILSASSIGVLDILLLLISINSWSRGSFKSLLSINASSTVEWLNPYWISVSVFACLWSTLFWCTTAVAVRLMDSYCCSVYLYYKVRLADNQCYVTHEQCFNRVVWPLCFMITNVNVGKTPSSSPSSSLCG